MGSIAVVITLSTKSWIKEPNIFPCVSKAGFELASIKKGFS